MQAIVGVSGRLLYGLAGYWSAIMRGLTYRYDLTPPLIFRRTNAGYRRDQSVNGRVFQCDNERENIIANHSHCDGYMEGI